MKKNVASQAIGAQMVSASDGSAFTGSVTVYVTGDAGTQALGSVGSGACTHEGNGYHTYAPAQAETNYDLIAFTFTGTGAIPATIQVYTSFPQTGDNYARLGAPAGASMSADIAAVKVDTAAILVDTGTTLDARIPAALVGGRMDVSVGAMASNVITAAATATDFGAEIADAVWDEATAGHVTAGSTGVALTDILTDTAEIGAAGAGLTALATQASVNTIDDFIDTEVAAIKAVTDAIGATGTGLTAIPWNAAWDAEVQSECTDALNAYDPPTNAEMEARTPTAAQLAYIVSNAADGVPVTFTGGTTTTAILGNVDGSAASSTDDYYNGRILVFNAGTLDMQVTDITDYVGSTKTATITAVTTAVTASHTANLK